MPKVMIFTPVSEKSIFSKEGCFGKVSGKHNIERTVRAVAWLGLEFIVEGIVENTQIDYFAFAGSRNIAFNPLVHVVGVRNYCIGIFKQIVAVVEAVAKLFEVVNEYHGLGALFHHLFEKQVAQTDDARILDCYGVAFFYAQTGDYIR